MTTIEQIIKESKYSILYDGDRMSQYLMKFKSSNYMVNKEELNRHTDSMPLSKGIESNAAFVGVGFAIITVRYD